LNPITILAWVLFGLLVLALVVAAFVATSWYVGCRHGSRAVWWVWPVVAALIAAFYIVRLHLGRAALGHPFPARREVIEFGAYFLFWLVALSGTTWSVYRRLERRSRNSLSIGTAAAGVGAFFAVVGSLLFVVMVTDLWQLFIPR
jgi:hypothetical protein